MKAGAGRGSEVYMDGLGGEAGAGEKEGAAGVAVDMAGGDGGRDDGEGMAGVIAGAVGGNVECIPGEDHICLGARYSSAGEAGDVGQQAAEGLGSVDGDAAGREFYEDTVDEPGFVAGDARLHFM